MAPHVIAKKVLMSEAAVLFISLNPNLSLWITQVFVINYIIFFTVLKLLRLNFSKVVSVIHVIRLRIFGSLFRQLPEFSLFARNLYGDKDTGKDSEIVFCVSEI